MAGKPGVPCGGCVHSERVALDSVIHSEPERQVAKRFGISSATVHRHKDHVVKSIARATILQNRKEISESGTLIERLALAHREAWDILREARDASDNPTRIEALKRIEKQLELEGRILGEIRDGGTTNLTMVLVSPAWAQIHDAVLRALTEFPEARLAVGAALKALPRQVDPAGALAVTRAE